MAGLGAVDRRAGRGVLARRHRRAPLPRRRLVAMGQRPPPHDASRSRLAMACPACALACLERMAEVLAGHADEICAVILEPLVQAAGGMITAPPGYLRRVRELCGAHDVLLIVDEVATGAGRTGTFFACEQEGVTPDILVAGKGLTGGYLPLAAPLTTQAVFDAFLGEPAAGRTFFHGHTYTGNPLACAAALANLDLMGKRHTVEGVRERGEVLAEELAPLAGHPHVGGIRRRGPLGGSELGAGQGRRWG